MTSHTETSDNNNNKEEALPTRSVQQLLVTDGRGHTGRFTGTVGQPADDNDDDDTTIQLMEGLIEYTTDDTDNPTNHPTIRSFQGTFFPSNAWKHGTLHYTNGDSGWVNCERCAATLQAG